MATGFISHQIRFWDSVLQSVPLKKSRISSRHPCLPGVTQLLLTGVPVRPRFNQGPFYNPTSTTQPKLRCISWAELLRSGIDDKRSNRSGDSIKHHIAATLNKITLATGQRITGVVDSAPTRFQDVRLLHCCNDQISQFPKEEQLPALTTPSQIDYPSGQKPHCCNFHQDEQPIRSSATVIRRHRTKTDLRAENNSTNNHVATAIGRLIPRRRTDRCPGKQPYRNHPKMNPTKSLTRTGST